MATNMFETMKKVPPSEKMTFEEFLDWCDEDIIAEWVDGEVIAASPAEVQHQQIAKLLLSVLHIYIEEHPVGAILHAPFLMRLSEIARAREPDLLFISNERSHLLRPTYLDGAADLAVEIVSPESTIRDHRDKLDEYERGRVKEYWLIDPDQKQAEFYELGTDGRYRSGEIDGDGIYRSKVIPGFWLKVSWLWRAPLPTAIEVLRELKIVVTVES